MKATVIKSAPKIVTMEGIDASVTASATVITQSVGHSIGPIHREMRGQCSVKIVADDPKFIPKPASAMASALDLVANLEATIRLNHRAIAIIDCGFAMELPPNWEAQIRPRSGLAAKGLTIPNSPGTIDADYRGKVKVIVANFGKEIVVIEPGDRFAQMVVKPVYDVNWEVVSSLSPTERADNGFGSTGAK